MSARLPAHVVYVLDRDSYADAQMALIEAHRQRKAEARRAEDDRKIAAVAAERLARTEEIARSLVREERR